MNLNLFSMPEVPVWRGPSLCADRWRSILKAPPFLVRMLKYGIKDPPIIPFTQGMIMSAVPQTLEDRSFASRKIAQGLAKRTIEEISEPSARKCARDGLLVSSSFVTWTGEGEEKRGRFVINLHRQRKHFKPGCT